MKPKAFLLLSRMLYTGRSRSFFGSPCCPRLSALGHEHIRPEPMANREVVVQAASGRRSGSPDLLDLRRLRRLSRITSSTIIPQLTHRQP